MAGAAEHYREPEETTHLIACRIGATGFQFGERLVPSGIFASMIEAPFGGGRRSRCNDVAEEFRRGCSLWILTLPAAANLAAAAQPSYDEGDSARTRVHAGPSQLHQSMSVCAQRRKRPMTYGSVTSDLRSLCAGDGGGKRHAEHERVVAREQPLAGDAGAPRLTVISML